MEDFLAGPTRDGEEMLRGGNLSASPCSEAGSAEGNCGDVGHSEG